jgi:hypothetical protein
MHRLPSSRAVTRFNLASWGMILVGLLILPVVGCSVCGFFLMDSLLLEVALYLIVATFSIGIIQWLVSLNIRCPLCLTRLMVGQRCSKHRRAKKFLGSYRLRVACGVVLNKKFCCPYCGESTAVEARTVAADRRFT